MKDGFLRVAAVTTKIQVADCGYNGEQIIAAARRAPADASLLVFPELCVTGYTCGDLFLQPVLLQGAEAAVRAILDATLSMDAVLVVGVPVAWGQALYNCAAVCHRGRLLGLVPKANLPAYSEFYEARHFTPAGEAIHTITYAGQETLLGKNLLFACRNIPDFCLGVEICEDLWVAEQPSIALAAAGATVIANLSASDESVGKD